MRTCLLLAYLVLCGCGQNDDFVAPPDPGNLDKTPPYDLSLMLYPRDLGVLVEPDDMALGLDGFMPDASMPDQQSTNKTDLRTDHPDSG